MPENRLQILSSYRIPKIAQQPLSKIELIKVRSEIGAGTRGARMGIDALEVAAANKNNDFFSRYASVDVRDENHLLMDEIISPYAKRIKGIIEVYHRISKSVSKTLSKGSTPIVLSGDHANAGGTIAGIKNAFPSKRLGVIWIDAHADLNTPYTTPSGNIHGMPLAASLGIDNKEYAINSLDEDTIEYWEDLKQTGRLAPKFLTCDLNFFGVRDVDPAEEKFMTEHKIRNFTVEELRKKGAKSCVEESLNLLIDCDFIYVSFDVDSLGENISGTGTPVPNGFTKEEAANLIKEFVRSKKVCCFEMVEINPTLDKQGNKTAEIAFDILNEVSKEFEDSFKE